MSVIYPLNVKNFFKQKFQSLKGRLKNYYSNIKYGKNIFLIYSMGKVGTTSVYKLTHKKYPHFPIHHVHFLSDNWVKRILPALNSEFHGNIKVANEVYKSLQRYSTHRIKIITMVREPLMREVSDIFENWRGLLKADSINNLSFQMLKDYLDTHSHEYVLNWFDSEFKEYLDFDIYSAPFDKEKGFSIYKTTKADILCIKLEKLNECITTAIKEFSGLTIENSSSANSSEQKPGKELYRLLNKNYKAPKSKLQTLYQSKYVTHFYNNEEINSFIRKWSHGELQYDSLFGKA